MSTTIRPELSEKNKYWIDRHRYYELKHFCMQYPLWKRMYNSLSSYQSPCPLVITSSKTNMVNDPITKNLEERLFYSDRIDMLCRVAEQTDKELSSYILKAVTEGISYDHLKARTNIPCCKDVYYDLYRRFFWILNKERR